ncbi:MAG TPA: lytic transglycosylase domain-containing protein [Stellaceae bacterium]|nr:lytic transglycosylase domain-containing protein [Stellaceae bacterium]
MLRETDLPTVLSRSDVARYQRIFALQDKGAWAEADHEIAGLKDKLLLGHVLAARYLARHYRASYGELAAWLARYADEPDAKAIYELALSRKPTNVKGPTRPIAASSTAAADDDADPTDGAASAHAALVAQQIRGLAEAKPRQAAQLLIGPEARRLLDADTRSTLRAVIAESFLRSGDTQDALVLSAAPQDAPAVPSSVSWQAGLDAWQHGRLGEAASHFETLLQTAAHAPWLKSQAAFWLARVALRVRRPDHVAYWLGIAAEEPRTFYGLIARRLLGEDLDFHFDAEPFTALDARVIMGLDAGRRALALIAVGQSLRAAKELRTLAESDDPALLQSLVSVADRGALPALSLELAGTLGETDGRSHDGSLYPVPNWTPQGGFTVDRALLFALMRQESLFVPRVASASGALGVMQLMPATARDMAQRTGMTLPDPGNGNDERDALADPELNLTLAQEYVRTLLASPAIKGNLLMFALAYNEGPTAASRLQDLANQYHRDPLLFLESIPSQEARQFTKHVLTNYWIYRIRLGQSTHDLDILAAGLWPSYIALDTDSELDGRHAAYR